ncbi:hypothetical protein SS50377_20546 [Spironucleus salmonicida]|uniref:Uncharacterized protein n=1 Tax=Spironucleus salmonicida TaxID=348837 RepID=V6M437_9EUKA|nr:hypothetical protein SS50377_20546 [Spironucleus salmonicida]|eukprot:EST48089.1 Hypothetical protein SS50377_11787 [Spironucleus salmonicida]
MSTCELTTQKWFRKTKQECKFQILNDQLQILAPDQKYKINMSSPKISQLHREDCIIYVDKQQKISAAIKIEQTLAVEDNSVSYTVMNQGSKVYTSLEQQ